jgi:hypothetical protein
MGDTPDKYCEAQIYGNNCTAREWREALQIGHWASDECFMYDLSSAYPSEAARLPDLRYARYVYSKEMVDSAYWGFLRGRVTINGNVRCSPIMTRLPDGRMVNPVGCWNTFLTLDEVRFAPRASNGGRQLVRPSVKVLQFASEGQKVKRTTILTS